MANYADFARVLGVPLTTVRRLGQWLDKNKQHDKTGIAFLSRSSYGAVVTTISLKIPDDLASRLDALARMENTSRSALFRQALAEKVQASARRSTPSLYELSADLCGIGASGIGDLASNPKHLEDFGA